MDFSIIGIIVLILDIIALFSVWASQAKTSVKLIWTLVILFLPVLGLIGWFLFGPRRGRLQP